MPARRRQVSFSGKCDRSVVGAPGAKSAYECGRTRPRPRRRLLPRLGALPPLAISKNLRRRCAQQKASVIASPAAAAAIVLYAAYPSHCTMPRYRPVAATAYGAFGCANEAWQYRALRGPGMTPWRVFSGMRQHPSRIRKPLYGVLCRTGGSKRTVIAVTVAPA